MPSPGMLLSEQSTGKYEAPGKALATPLTEPSPSPEFSKKHGASVGQSSPQGVRGQCHKDQNTAATDVPLAPRDNTSVPPGTTRTAQGMLEGKKGVNAEGAAPPLPDAQRRKAAADEECADGDPTPARVRPSTGAPTQAVHSPPAGLARSRATAPEVGNPTEEDIKLLPRDEAIQGATSRAGTAVDWEPNAKTGSCCISRCSRRGNDSGRCWCCGAFRPHLCNHEGRRGPAARVASSLPHEAQGSSQNQLEGSKMGFCCLHCYGGSATPAPREQTHSGTPAIRRCRITEKVAATAAAGNWPPIRGPQPFAPFMPCQCSTDIACLEQAPEHRHLVELLQLPIASREQTRHHCSGLHTDARTAKHQQGHDTSTSSSSTGCSAWLDDRRTIGRCRGPYCSHCSCSKAVLTGTSPFVQKAGLEQQPFGAQAPVGSTGVPAAPPGCPGAEVPACLLSCCSQARQDRRTVTRVPENHSEPAPPDVSALSVPAVVYTASGCPAVSLLRCSSPGVQRRGRCPKAACASPLSTWTCKLRSPTILPNWGPQVMAGQFLPRALLGRQHAEEPWEGQQPATDHVFIYQQERQQQRQQLGLQSTLEVTTANTPPAANGGSAARVVADAQDCCDGSTCPVAARPLVVPATSQANQVSGFWRMPAPRCSPPCVSTVERGG